jgi:hypothetical protein
MDMEPLLVEIMARPTRQPNDLLTGVINRAVGRARPLVIRATSGVACRPEDVGQDNIVPIQAITQLIGVFILFIYPYLRAD